MLLDLHRAAMRAEANWIAGDINTRTRDAADDAFRDYLMRLEISE